MSVQVKEQRCWTGRLGEGQGEEDWVDLSLLALHTPILICNHAQSRERLSSRAPRSDQPLELRSTSTSSPKTSHQFRLSLVPHASRSFECLCNALKRSGAGYGLRESGARVLDGRFEADQRRVTVELPLHHEGEEGRSRNRSPKTRNAERDSPASFDRTSASTPYFSHLPPFTPQAHYQVASSEARLVVRTGRPIPQLPSSSSSSLLLSTSYPSLYHSHTLSQQSALLPSTSLPWTPTRRTITLRPATATPKS